MKRREFSTLFAGSLLASPLPAVAQSQAKPLIGFLSSRSENDSRYVLAAFRKGLDEGGFVEGQNIAIEYRWAQGHYEQLPTLAADLVKRGITLLVAVGGEPSALAAKAATPTIPIVFTTGGDPVKIGLVASLSRPGGNATGYSLMTTAPEAKRLELLNDLSPSPAIVGALIDANYQEATTQEQELKTAAAGLGKQLVILKAGTSAELEQVFGELAERRPNAMVVTSSPFFDTQRDRIIAFANRTRLPAVYQFREYAVAGGLMSYGISLTDGYRGIGTYAARILKGTKPSELPVLQPVRFELVINAATARALGSQHPIGSSRPSGRGGRMKRRDLMAVAVTVGIPSWVWAQSPALPRIGYLWLGTPGSDGTTKSGLLKGLEDLGYIDGKTISIDYRYADGNEARLAPLLAELIAAKPALLVTPGVVATRAAMNATKTVPIVSATTDPVGSGFAASLAWPGRNITGVAITAGAEVAEKWVEFARELVPGATRIALLLNPSSTASATYSQRIRALAGPLGLVLTFHGVTDRQELAGALESIAMANPQALIVDADALLYANNKVIVAFANARRLPAVYALREFVDSGGLMSYGASIFESWRSAAKHIDQILKGAMPADLPIEQPTKFDLIINLKAARSQGITISPLLLARADEVIE